ncbi:MAG: flagellar FliJ family protein [Phycisphaerales bacterium]|jgi:flagellar FliJ protein
MKRFVWRLQRVLDVRRKEEQKARTELFELTEKLAQTRGLLMAQRKTLEDIINALCKENPGKRLGKQEFFLRYSSEIDERIKELENKVTELEAQKRDKIVEVLKLRRLKEGMERLRNEAKMQFIKEQEKLEQQQLDERAIVSFVRKVRS